MSKELAIGVEKLITDVVTEVDKFFTDASGRILEEDINPFDVEAVIQRKELYRNAAICKLGQQSPRVAYINTELETVSMISTLKEDVRSLQSVLSIDKDHNKASLEEFANFGKDSSLWRECEEESLDDLKEIEAEAKENFETVLKGIYPNVRMEIKEVLSMLEAALKNAKKETDKHVTFDSDLYAAVEILEKTGIIEKTGQNTFKLNHFNK